MGKSLAKNYIYNMVAQVLTIIVPLITTPYVSRILEADGLGAYSYTYSIVSYFCIFARMGLDVYGQLKIAQHSQNLTERSNIFWGVFAAKALLTGIVCGFYFLMIYRSAEYKRLYLALTLCLIAQLLDISWFYQGLEEFGKTVVRNCVTKLISVIMIFLLIRQKSDLVLYVVIVQGALALGNAALWFGLSKDVQRPERGSLRILWHLKSNLIYFIPTIATSIYTMLDRSMIGWITGSEFQNGYYEQAHKIEQILVTVITSLSMVTLPRLKYMFCSGDETGAKKIIDNSTKFVSMISLPMMMGVAVVAPYLIPWFLGDGYEQCISLLQIFAVLMPVVGLNNVVGKQCLMATERQKYYNIGVTVGAVTNVVLNLLLIPKLQSHGAAIASVVSEFVILVLFIVFAKEYFSVKDYVGSFFKYLAASGLMAAAVWFVGNRIGGGTVGLILQVGAGIVVYFVVLLLTKDQLIVKALQKIRTKGK